jgi:putative transposase
MIKAHKIRLNPTPEQEAYFRRAAGTARFVYNWGLARWIRLYEAGERPSIWQIKQEFNAIKGEQFPWVYEVAKDVAENAFFNLAKAFKNFFESHNGQRKGEKVGYPRFKSKKRSKLSFRVIMTWCLGGTFSRRHHLALEEGVMITRNLQPQQRQVQG